LQRLILLAAALALTAAACASDTEAVAETTAATTTTSAATTTTLAPPSTTTSSTAPATTTTTEAAPAGYVPGEDPEADAAVDAFSVVFDSATTYDEKVPFLVEPEGLEETVTAYGETGGQVGGVTVETNAIVIDGDKADITYTLQFGGNPTYAGLSGSVVRTDVGWQITRAMFCSLMSSARVGCPSE